MRAAVTKWTSMEIREGVPDPRPGPGQVLARTLACGICGSDLHALAHPEQLDRLCAAAGVVSTLGPDTEYVLGHEFVAEIVEHGPQTQGRLPVGGRVCALPFALVPDGVDMVGFSPALPGGYGELMVLQEELLFSVPDGVPSQVAALTEPLAVGERAVAVGQPQPGWPCHVVGCGPIGLTIILALKARGLSPVTACDPAPARRALAAQLGADVVLDPADGDGFPDFAEFGVPTSPMQRTASVMTGAEPPRAVVFEAVGKPGIIDAITEAAPAASRIVVAGVCGEPDRFVPATALVKELEFRFSFAYTPTEFTTALTRVAETPDTVAPLISTTIDLDDIADAIEALRSGQQVKVMIEHP
jgi:threonine dehydrogenase-like Zn-dependent dehydrogenase